MWTARTGSNRCARRMRCASDTRRNSAPSPSKLQGRPARRPPAGLVVAVEDLVGHPAIGPAVHQRQRVGAVPLDADDGDRAVREDAPDGGVGCRSSSRIVGPTQHAEWTRPALLGGYPSAGCVVESGLGRIPANWPRIGRWCDNGKRGRHLACGNAPLRLSQGRARIVLKRNAKTLSWPVAVAAAGRVT